jgi:uncharacterized membrane protein YccC
MRLLATTPESNLGRLPIALDLRAISLAEGARAALSIAIIVAADEWVHWPLLLEAALAALLTCLGDSGGPISRRLPALFGFTLLGTLLTIGFSLARGAGLPVVLPLACAGIFLCSFARIWGQSAMQAGNLLVVVLVLAMDESLTLPQALMTGGVFAAGSLWAVLLTMVLWRIYPFRPARRAVADAYRATARLVADLRGLVEAQAAPEAWEAHARGHRRAVRDTIERARTAVQDTLRARGQSTPRAFQALLRIEAIDQLFGATIALSDLLEANRDPAVQEAADRLLRLLRPVLVVIAEAIVADDAGMRRNDRVGRLARIGPAVDEIAATGSVPALAPFVDAITERLRAALTLTAPAGWKPGALPDTEAPEPWLRRIVGPWRANMNWQSAALRHALRATVVAAPAMAFTLSVTGRYQHWLIITVVLTMQPFYALTWQRALERIGGTVLGGLMAAAIAVVCTTPLTIAAALFPLAIAGFTLRAVNYGAFITFLTPLVVLLTEFSQPGSGELTIATMRALYTVAGGVLAVLGCLLLWPSWEPDRLKREVRTAILAHAAFAEAELDNLLGAGSVSLVEVARRAAGMASNNLETTLSRAMLEPRRSVRAELQAMMVMDAALRRMAGRLSALQLDPHGADGIDPDSLRAWRQWIGGSLRAMADGPAELAHRPAGRAPEPLMRIARQIELMGASGPGLDVT